MAKAQILHEAHLVSAAGSSDEERRVLDEALEEFARDRDPGQPWREVLTEIRSRRS